MLIFTIIYTSNHSRIITQMRPTLDFFRFRTLQSRIFFLHIPKCAGTSFFRALASCYGLGAFLSRNAVAYLDPIASTHAADLLEKELHDYRKSILAYYMCSNRCKCIGGHFAFSQQLFDRYSDDWRFITLLRDPIDVWYSHYSYFLRTTTPDLPSYPLSKLTLEQFLEQPLAAALGSTFVRVMIADTDISDPAAPEAINLAIERLRRFALLGTVEELDVFQRAFESSFNVTLRIPHSNRGRSKVADRLSVSPAIRKRVEEICKPNVQVYNGIRAFCSGHSPSDETL